ncbi:MAG: HPr family phosphocarrier protein [Planctomycetota bacterium]|nr:MAG: HPr family phosphocarrier protein [Planctomycetota bacterium]
MTSTMPWTEKLPHQEVISEREFGQRLDQEGRDFLLLGNQLLHSSSGDWSYHQVYLLYGSATEIETYLDDHGARENRSFFPIREMVALIRWLSLSLSSLLHLDSRLRTYENLDENWLQGDFQTHLGRGKDLLSSRIQICLKSLRSSWVALDLPWPESVPVRESLPASGQSPRLARNLIEEREQVADSEKETVSEAAQMAARYLSLESDFKKLRKQAEEAGQSRRAFMAEHFREDVAREYEARVHNLQSLYDSQISASDVEIHQELPILRGAISIAFHLLESATALTHLYERHDVYGRLSETRQTFERLIGEEQLLTFIISSLLESTYESFCRNSPAVQALLQSSTTQISKTFSIPEGIQLHARPISLIVGIVNHFGTPVEMEVAGKRCSAASIMQMLVLLGSHPDVKEITFEGDEPALVDLERLFSAHLGEKGMERLPPTLDYLRRN